ncbi:MAG TPA: hypothetical protein VM841_12895 [Actinomycetota bacterium]|nr:hypothetical protein [Actinomycetota bacterium]
MTERVAVKGLRTLGAPPKAKRSAAPKRNKTQQAGSDMAKKVLQAEFRKALKLKEKLAGEQAALSDDKGRDVREAEKLRSIVASLEGMSRFAIVMGLLTPEENRALWANAMKKGLYEGWR